MERDLRALREPEPRHLCGVAAAVIVSATSLGSAAMQSSAAKKAANTQANAANRAADMQLQMFDTIRGDLSPYRSFGAGALPGLSALLGYGGGSSGAGAGYDPFFGYNTGSTAAKPSGGFAGVSPVEGASSIGPYAADGSSRAVSLGDGLAPDWNAYAAANPDVLAWAKGGGGDPTLPIDQQSLEQRLAYHYFNSGMGEGRQLPTMAAPQAAAGGAIGANGMQLALENIPGYQFMRQQGMQAVTNALGAKGLGGLSGAYGKGIARFVTGLADTTYGEQINRLMAAATLGQNAAVQTGSAGLNATSNAGNALLGGAGAQAAGTIGSANAWAQGLGGLSNAALLGRSGLYGGGSNVAPTPIGVAADDPLLAFT